ncbi:hypothetical protein MMC29_004952, partial [Sticta canariensis]|nr:hypothetical protein [Sticta canariensis]
AIVLGFTREQLDAKFALDQRKAEAELAAIEARTHREDEESQALIAAIQSAAVVAVLRMWRRNLPYHGLPKAEIARIFSNKYRLENLYKLRHLKGRDDKDREENVTIENGVMKLKRATRNLCDFGPSLDTWSEAFLNYSMIMVDFFGVAFPSLFRVLSIFHQKICSLSKIYD